MCGIVGYIGRKGAKSILIDGLKRLEYRGYDSAGIAVFDKKNIKCVKTKGKIAVLESKIKINFPEGTLGIAHTRWATHGKPSDVNAHPHWDCKKRIMVVHNGIIENYAELKKKLQKAGHKFLSETDTEVLPHLIEENYRSSSRQSGDSLREAVRKSLLELEGTYGVAVISSDDPDKLIAARHGSPLIVGIGEDEYFVASDITAILPYTKKVIYPEDGEMVELSREGFKTINVKNKEVAKKIEEIDLKATDASKQGFDFFMLKEIFEQPQSIRNASAGRVVPEEGVAHLGGINMTDNDVRKVKRILFLGCGTAYHAGLVGKYMIEEYAHVPVDVEYASEFRYKEINLDPNTLVFVISQSGETADTIAAMREVHRKGFKVMGISNVVGSTIARETDGGTFIHAGPEIGVASTKAFMGQITVLAILALQFGRVNGMSFVRGKRLAEAILKTPSQVEEILKNNEQIKKIAKKYSKYRNFLYLGRKFNYPIALEGALKLKEISYIHAEGYPAAEMKHGTIALIDKDFPTLVIVPKDSVYDKTVSNIEEIKARHGKVIAIATKGDKKIKKLVDDVIYIPKTIEMLLPLLTVVPTQLLAYHIAVLKGRDVDKPRNLAKSVTVE